MPVVHLDEQCLRELLLYPSILSDENERHAFHCGEKLLIKLNFNYTRFHDLWLTGWSARLRTVVEINNFAQSRMEREIAHLVSSESSENVHNILYLSLIHI